MTTLLIRLIIDRGALADDVESNLPWLEAEKALKKYLNRLVEEEKIAKFSFRRQRYITAREMEYRIDVTLNHIPVESIPIYTDQISSILRAVASSAVRETIKKMRLGIEEARERFAV